MKSKAKNDKVYRYLTSRSEDVVIVCVAFFKVFQIMSIKYNTYCRLEHLCLYEIKDRHNLKQEKSLKLSEDYVYVENYNDFQLVKSRIIELNKIWRNRYPEKERYWSQEEKQAHFIGGTIIDDRVRDRYIVIFLYNRWGDQMILGVTYLGWIIPGVLCYTLDSINNRKRLGKLDLKKERTFVFNIPEWTEFRESKFISQESACSLIKEWLDTGEYTQYFTNELGQIETRKNTLNRN